VPTAKALLEARPATAPEEIKPTSAAAPADRLPAVPATEAVPAPAHQEEPVPAPAEHAPPAPPSEPATAPAPHGRHAPAGPAAQLGAEHGAEHGEHAGFSVGTFVLQLLNFGALLFLLIYFGGPRLNKFLRARHEQLKGDIGEATRLHDEAKQKFDAQAQRLAEMEKEIAALRESMRKEAEREQARMVEAAQEKAKRIQDEMRAQLDEQVKVAEAALRAEVATASVALAEDLLRKAVNFEDERRLAREFVVGFDEPAGPDGEAR
jgi:F0F1-type ATP synthase membrane subunit b/b'